MYTRHIGGNRRVAHTTSIESKALFRTRRQDRVPYRAYGCTRNRMYHQSWIESAFSKLSVKNVHFRAISIELKALFRVWRQDQTPLLHAIMTKASSSLIFQLGLENCHEKVSHEAHPSALPYGYCRSLPHHHGNASFLLESISS